MGKNNNILCENTQKHLEIIYWYSWYITFLVKIHFVHKYLLLFYVKVLFAYFSPYFDPLKMTEFT